MREELIQYYYNSAYFAFSAVKLCLKSRYGLILSHMDIPTAPIASMPMSRKVPSRPGTKV